MPPCCGQHVAQPSLVFSELASSHAHHCKPLNHLCLSHRMSQCILMRTLMLSQSICSAPRLTCLARELGSTLGEQDRLCPVSALLGYLVRHGQQPGPLFLFQDGSTLSKQRLLARVNAALACQGFDTMGISGHSFRVGAATTAARVGMEDSLIQTLGRWWSSAYLRYIHMSGQMLAPNLARLLTLSPHSRIAEDETQEN